MIIRGSSNIRAIGSVRVATDKNGQVVQRYDYTPFGTEWQPATDRESRRFTAQQWDSETGLDYFGARLYQSQEGRFTKPDDPGFIDLVNPQTLNLYGYAFNNPLRYNDPTGHSADCVGAFDAKTGLCEPVSFNLGLFDFMRDSWRRFHTAAERITDATYRFVNAPRDPTCLSNWTGAGVARGLAVGTALGAGTGGVGILITAPGAIAVNVAGGIAVGSVACMGSATGGGGGDNRSQNKSFRYAVRQIERA